MKSQISVQNSFFASFCAVANFLKIRIDFLLFRTYNFIFFLSKFLGLGGNFLVLFQSLSWHQEFVALGSKTLNIQTFVPTGLKGVAGIFTNWIFVRWYFYFNKLRTYNGLPSLVLLVEEFSTFNFLKEFKSLKIPVVGPFSFSFTDFQFNFFLFIFSKFRLSYGRNQVFLLSILNIFLNYRR